MCILKGKVNGIPTNISRVLATTLLLFILIGCLFNIKVYRDLQTLSLDEKQSIMLVRELEWNSLVDILLENYDKADTLSNTIKDRVALKIDREYPDKSILKEDLDSPKVDAKVYAIFSDELRSKTQDSYKTDTTDPFIASVLGIYSDNNLSKSTSTIVSPLGIRDWQSEIDKQSNKVLAVKAIDAITNQHKYPIFWEPLKSNYADHELIDTMDLKSLHQVFINEGFDGLKTYEFLRPAYLYEHTDIFGVNDVNNLGQRQKNNKIIVVSGFNLYDIMTSKYKVELAKYDDMIEKARDVAYERRSSEILYALLVMCVIFFCIIITAILNNNIVKESAHAAKYNLNGYKKESEKNGSESTGI